MRIWTRKSALIQPRTSSGKSDGVVAHPSWKLPAVRRLAMAFAAKQRDWELSALVHRTYLEQCDGSSQQVPERNFS